MIKMLRGTGQERVQGGILMKKLMALVLVLILALGTCLAEENIWKNGIATKIVAQGNLCSKWPGRGCLNNRDEDKKPEKPAETAPVRTDPGIWDFARNRQAGEEARNGI